MIVVVDLKTNPRKVRDLSGSAIQWYTMLSICESVFGGSTGLEQALWAIDNIGGTHYELIIPVS